MQTGTGVPSAVAGFHRSLRAAASMNSSASGQGGVTRGRSIIVASSVRPLASMATWATQRPSIVRGCLGRGRPMRPFASWGPTRR